MIRDGTRGGANRPLFLLLFLCKLLVDVVCNDLVDGAVSLELFQSGVNLVEQLGVALLDSCCVVLNSVLGVQNLQTLVCLNVSLCRLVIDNNCIDLTVYQSLRCNNTGRSTLYMLLTQVAGAEQVTGGAGLYAYGLISHIFYRSDGGILRDNNSLNTGCIGFGKVNLLSTLGINSHTSQNDIDLICAPVPESESQTPC